MIFLPKREKTKRPPSNPLYGMALLFTVLLGLYALRLHYLQIIEYQRYTTMSKDNRLQPRSLRAVRGEIRASDGTLLVTNRNAVELVYKGGEIKQLERIARLAGFTLPIEQPKDGEYEIVVKKDVPESNIPALEEWLAGQQEVLELRYRVQRTYPSGLAGNLLGYMEPANADDLELKDANGNPLYDTEDLVPKAGLEAGLETLLHGQHGEKLEEVDSKGRVVVGRDRVVREAARGKTITLSLIPKLQRAAEKAIEEAKDEINAKNRQHGVALISKARGAIVALNPKTGQILALAVGPKYDPNWFSSRPRDKKAGEALLDKYLPMWNRAVKIFEPGSTFKLVTNSALLEGGAGNPYFQCMSTYYLGRAAFRNWNRYRNMGSMNAQLAIANSCNTWYFQSAVRFGTRRFAEMLAKRAREFGFGEPTGIELIGETGGLVPSPTQMEADGRRKWYPGNSLNYAIGQGDMRATPLQIARMLATIVNDGKRPELTLVKAVDGKIQPPKPMVQLSGTHWSTLKQGMEITVTRGTAKEILRDFPIRTAGKTGTAENPKGPNQDHAWYMGYGPVADPNLVVVAFFENGVEGSGIALPAVRKVMAAYWNIPLTKK